MKLRWLAMFLAVSLGCADTRWEQRQPTQSDPPAGGGFESSRRPGGADDPLDPNLRRTEWRPVWRGDNGAPETRVNTGGGGPVGSNPAAGGGGGAGPDARIDRRVQ
jgi:hypothetical protein